MPNKPPLSLSATFSKLLPWLLPITVLVAWLLFSWTGWLPAYLLPPPQEVARTAFEYIFTTGNDHFAGRFWLDLQASLGRVASGFALAVLLGVPLGILSGRVAWVQRLLGGSITALRSVPGICWLPLALIWFGIGFKTTLFLVALAAFFPIYLNAESGARQVNKKYIQLAAMFGAGKGHIVFRVIIPATMPHLIGGLRLGLGISWAYLVLGELTGASHGLGATIMDARMMGRTDIILVGIILIATLGKLSDSLLRLFLSLSFKSARRCRV